MRAHFPMSPCPLVAKSPCPPIPIPAMKPIHFALNHSLPRRSFLRGVGVALALPMLDAMRPAFGASTPTVKRRMVAVCTTLGIYPESLYPKATGRGYTASPYSQVIDEFRDQFTIFSGLSHPEV